MTYVSKHGARAGFSLIEVLFATATIGIGVTALMTALSPGASPPPVLIAILRIAFILISSFKRSAIS